MNIIYDLFSKNVNFILYCFRRITFLWQIGPIAISVDVSNQFRFRRKSVLRRLRRNCWWPRICGLFKSIKGFRTESVRLLEIVRFDKKFTINTQSTGSVSWFNNITFSWHQKMKPPIHQFKLLHKDQSLLQPLFNGVLFLIHYFRNISSLVFSFLKALKTFCSTVNSLIGSFVFLMSRTDH